MKYEFKPSFERSIKRLETNRKEKIKEAVLNTVNFFEKHIKPRSLGLKHLRCDYWEIRTGIKDRIIFRLNNGIVEFVLAGSHSDIKNFLKNI